MAAPVSCRGSGESVEYRAGLHVNKEEELHGEEAVEAVETIDDDVVEEEEETDGDGGGEGGAALSGKAAAASARFSAALSAADATAFAMYASALALAFAAARTVLSISFCRAGSYSTDRPADTSKAGAAPLPFQQDVALRVSPREASFNVDSRRALTLRTCLRALAQRAVSTR